ncbi:TPA: hypothetical protein O2E31_000550 [Enterococcus faecalis]|nr:hypothetical protein [Enterococcus faecalis]
MGYRSEIGQIGKELLSGYKQIALVDVAIPIYFLDISCFCNKIETLPVIQDTLLRLIDQKFKLTDIPKIMGLENDIEIFEKAFYDLLYYEVIKKNGIISEVGRDYLKDEQLNRFIKLEKKVCVDGLSGEIILSNHQRYANDKEQVIDILKVNRIRVNYKRAQLAVHVSTTSQDSVQLLLFDRAIRLSEYDDLIDETQLSDLVNLNMEAGNFFSSDSIVRFKGISDQFEKVVKEDAIERFDRLIFEAKKDIQLYIPFTQWTIPDLSMINMIENKLKQKLKVNLTLTGELLPSNYVMRRISQLEQLANDYVNFEIHHDLNYSAYCANADNHQNCSIDFKQRIVSDSNGDLVLFEPLCYELSQNQYQQLIAINDTQSGLPREIFKSPREVKEKLKKILDDFYLFDQAQRMLKRKSWVEGSSLTAQDHASFENIPLVTNRNNYEVMLTAINKFLFESLKDKYQAKYFFGDFKHFYPELFTFIDKNRLYRNAVQHTRLDKQEDREQLAQYLSKDTGGKYPGLFNNGYRAMQYLLLNQLQQALRNELAKIRK